MFKKTIFLNIGIGMMAILFFILLGSVKVDAASRVDTTKLSVQITSSGEPVKNSIFLAGNYDKAYRYITTGVFPISVVNSPAWQSVQNSTHTIIVAGLTMGMNNKHSKNEAETIISTLFNTNFTLLQSINETNNGAEITSFNPPTNFFNLHIPGGGAGITNGQGKAVGEVPIGLTAIVDGNSGRLIKLINVVSGMSEVKVDINSLGISLSFAQSGSAIQSRTVEFNEEIHYKLKVSKRILDSTTPTKIILRPDANVVIDETSIPNTVSSLVPPIINQSITFDPLAGSEQLNEVANKIGDELISWQINMYEIIIPPTDSSVSIDIKAHLAPTVYLNDLGIQQGVGTTSTVLNIPINAFDFPDRNFKITANVDFPTASTQVSTTSPEINTTGINFVTVDANKNKLVRDAVYVLGKTSEGKKYLYDSQGNWSETPDISAITPTSYTLLRGGNQYILGKNEAITIPLNTSRFNYNFERDTKNNQSLIKLFGLGEEKNYFLYQVATPTNYPMNKTPIDFSAFSEKVISPNGSQMTKTSMGEAVNQSFKLNSLIPDYSAGTNEYNLLAVTSQKKIQFSSVKSIILPLIVFVIGIAVIGYILVRVV